MPSLIQVAAVLFIVAIGYMIHVSRGSSHAEAATKALQPATLLQSHTVDQGPPQRTAIQIMRADAEAEAYRIMVARLGQADAERYGANLAGPGAGASAAAATPKQ
jgi:hypothetical protein